MTKTRMKLIGTYLLPHIILMLLIIGNPQKVNANNRSTPTIETTLEVPEDTTVYLEVDKMPEFLGGKEVLAKYLMTNIKYPIRAIENGIQGIVKFSFIVEKDGSLSNFEVIKNPSKILTKATLKVVKNMPSWFPGEHKGQKVRVRIYDEFGFYLRNPTITIRKVEDDPYHYGR